MSTPVWPLDLPLKLRYGLEQEFGNEVGKAITQFDAGNKLRRLRFTSVPVYLSTNLVFKDTEYERFISFYMDTLKQGTKTFIAPVIVGTTLAYHRCAFDNTSIKGNSSDFNRHEVSVVFEIRDAVIIDEATYWFIGTFGFEIGEEICDVLQHVVNVSYPEVVERY